MSLSLEIPGMKRLRIHVSDEDDDFEEPKRKKSPPLIQPRPSIDLVEDYCSMDYEEGVIVITDSPATTPSPKHRSMTPPSPEQSGESTFYTPYQQEILESLVSLLMDNPNQSCIVDLINFLDHCVAQCIRLTHAHILALLKLTSVLQSVRVVNKLHHILRQDLRLGGEPRPHASPEMMDGLNGQLNSALQLLRKEEERGSQLKYHTLQLTLNYFVKVLTSSRIPTSSVDKTTKWPFFSKIIQIIFLVAKNANLQGIVITYNELLDDLFLLLCVPLKSSSSQVVAQSIAFVFEEQLREVKSFDIRRHLLQLMPSVLLKQIVLDIHLENEFKYHPSNVTGIQASQDESMSLNKFCWIHLCRMPYYPNGSLHDLSFFLYLLYSLLESHLLILTTSPSKVVPHDLSMVLESVKPHVAGLVDRLSEDEVLLARLVAPCCWSDIQKLSSVIDTVITSLVM